MNNKTDNLKFDKYVDFKRELRSLKRDYRNLRDFTYIYARHLVGCAYYNNKDLTICTCGFSISFKLLNAGKEKK